MKIVKKSLCWWRCGSYSKRSSGSRDDNKFSFWKFSHNPALRFYVFYPNFSFLPTRTPPSKSKLAKNTICMVYFSYCYSLLCVWCVFACGKRGKRASLFVSIIMYYCCCYSSNHLHPIFGVESQPTCFRKYFVGFSFDFYDHFLV